MSTLSSTVTAASPSWQPLQKDTRERYEATGRRSSTTHRADASLVFETADNLEGRRGAGRAMLAAGMPSTAAFAATDYNALAS